MSARAVKQPPHPSTFETYVRCKDHLVSGENFDLLLDDNLDLLMTSPKPSAADFAFLLPKPSIHFSFRCQKIFG